MSVTFQSVQTNAWATGTSSVVTKPTSLAVGDLMIARAVYRNGDGGGVINLPTGFTGIGTQDDGILDSDQLHSKLGYKVADSGDVAASNFTFNTTLGDTVINQCSVIRITGASPVAASFKYNGGSTDNSATPSIAAGVTPTDYGNGSLLLQFWFGRSNVSSVSTYAIATSNPTWTEGYDLADSTTRVSSMAYGSRSQVTATGSVSAAGGNATTDWGVQLLAIPAPFSFTIADSTTTTDNKIWSLTINSSETITLTDSETANKVFPVSNQDKNTVSVSNTDKNTISVVNTDKNTVVVINIQKS